MAAIKLYSDTELDSDIKYVKEIILKYSSSYKDIEKNFSNFNKTVSNRICFISSQFKNVFNTRQMLA